MRPRIRPDCLFAPTEGGVLVASTDGYLRIGGEGIHTLLEQLAPSLDGGRTLAELTVGLAPPQQARLVELIEELARHGLVRDAAADQPHTLQPWELERYAEEIAFVDLAAGSGAHRFQRFRDQRVLVAGSGRILAGTVATLLRLGLREAVVQPTPEAETDPEALHGIAATEEAAGERLSVRPVAVEWEPPTAVDGLVAGYDLILHCSDRPMLERAVTLNRAGARVGTPVAHAVVVDGHAWVGPGPGGRGCWECAWLRLLGTVAATDPARPAHRLEDRPGAAAEEFLSEPLSELVGACLALAAFESVTLGPADGADSLTEIRLQTAVTERHRFLPHPTCGSCRPSRPPGADPLDVRLARVREREPLAVAEFSRNTARLVDRRTGLLVGVDESDLPQLPLNATRATVGDPVGSGSGRQSVVAVGDGFEQARHRAAVAAVERLADQLAGAGCTVAVGCDWDEAVGRALLRHCHARTVAAAPAQPPELDPAPWQEQDRYLRMLLQVAAHTGAEPRVADLTGPMGVPTVLVRGSGVPPAAASALDVHTAVRTALEASVARSQDLVPADWTIPPDLTGGGWESTVPELLAALEKDGWQVLVEPVDHDRALSELHPYLAAVRLRAAP